MNSEREAAQNAEFAAREWASRVQRALGVVPLGNTHGAGFRTSPETRPCPHCNGFDLPPSICDLCKGEHIVTHWAAVAYCEAHRDHAAANERQAQARLTVAIFGG